MRWSTTKKKRAEPPVTPTWSETLDEIKDRVSIQELDSKFDHLRSIDSLQLKKIA